MKPDITAPGVEIFAAYPTEYLKPGETGAFLSGTSMVSGAWRLFVVRLTVPRRGLSEMGSLPQWCCCFACPRANLSTCQPIFARGPTATPRLSAPPLADYATAGHPPYLWRCCHHHVEAPRVSDTDGDACFLDPCDVAVEVHGINGLWHTACTWLASKQPELVKPMMVVAMMPIPSSISCIVRRLCTHAKHQLSVTRYVHCMCSRDGEDVVVGVWQARGLDGQLDNYFNSTAALPHPPSPCRRQPQPRLHSQRLTHHLHSAILQPPL